MPKRFTRKTADAIVVSLCPDVCKTKVGSSVVPVPYPLFATFADTQKTSPNVNMQSTPAFNIESYLPNVTGNEAGKMGGVKSGVNKGIVNTQGKSSNVRINGKWAIRNIDEVEMNCAAPGAKGNTKGEVIYLNTKEKGEVKKVADKKEFTFTINRKENEGSGRNQADNPYSKRLGKWITDTYVDKNKGEKYDFDYYHHSKRAHTRDDIINKTKELHTMNKYEQIFIFVAAHGQIVGEEYTVGDVVSHKEYNEKGHFITMDSNVLTKPLYRELKLLNVTKVMVAIYACFYIPHYRHKENNKALYMFDGLSHTQKPYLDLTKGKFYKTSGYGYSGYFINRMTTLMRKTPGHYAVAFFYGRHAFTNPTKKEY